MSQPLRDDVNLARIFEKLGHQLEEIRVRALTNILSKLDHKLVSLHDLVQEKHFLIRLLEWFNFPNAPKQIEVIDLMCQVSEHAAAAEILTDVGAVDFLTHLRMDTTAAIKLKIDVILDNLMKLPDFNQGPNGANYIFYQKPNLYFDSFPTDQAYVNNNDPLHAPMSGMSVTLNIPSSSKTHRPSNNSNSLPHPVPERSSLFSTSFNKFSVLSSGFKTTTFPWLSLTQTDRQVLSSTNSLLQCKDANMLISACEFLQDVVFHDFPAEVFLQRPNIVQSLFQLLDLPSNQPSSNPNQNLFLMEPNLTLEACKTLNQLLGCLSARLKYHEDPAFHISKQDFPSSGNSLPSHNASAGSGSVHSTDTRFSALGKSDSRCRGDGRDGDSSSTSRSSFQSIGEVLLFSSEDLETDSAQQQQLILPQFCIELMMSALSLLERTSDLNHIFVIFRLLYSNLKLLGKAINPAIWNDNNSASRHIVICLNKCLESISNLMQLHHHSNKTTINKADQTAQNRQIFLSLASFCGCFLKQFVPVDKIKLPVPDSLSSTLELVVFDECLSQMWPELHSLMLSYLHKVANERYLLYTQTARVCTSLQRMCYFLSKTKIADGSVEELLNLAEEALLGITYHIHKDFIECYIDFCSQFCSNLESSDTSSNGKQAREILCHLLAHPSSNVKEIAYTHCLEVIKNSLNINEAAANPSSCLSSCTKFVIHPVVLLEIVSFGMADQNKKISQSASDIMLYLLQGQLLLEGKMWEDLITSLTPVFPVLQSYADIESPLGYCILGLIEPKQDPGPNQLPLHERMRGVLRLLFSKDVKIRCEALKRLAWFLCHEEEHQNKVPSIQELDVTNLSNLFIVSNQVSLQTDHQEWVFNSDDVEKIYSIFTSATLEEQVKKSAIEQLVLILLDENLHQTFQRLGGIENILSHIQKFVLKPQNPEANTTGCHSFLPSCISILSLLLQHSNSLRHKLAQQKDLYYSLIRVALLYHKEDLVKTELAKIFTFLLFDEVILSCVSYKKPPEKKLSAPFSLPAAVCQRYHLPFKCPLHNEKSPNLNRSFISNDLLSSSLSCKEMIRFAWNFAWHQGIHGLLESVKNSSKTNAKESKYPDPLHLTAIDCILLQKSHLPTALQIAIDDISNATNHEAVSLALSQILIYLVSLSSGENQKPVSHILHQLKWTDTLCRFLQVVPSSPPDEWLLYQVLHFISSVFQFTVSIPESILLWFGELLYTTKGTLFSLLHQTETNLDLPEYATTIKRLLEKEAINVIIQYISHLPFKLDGKLKIQPLRGDLVLRLLIHLNVAEAPHFYNLASLEATLLCLMHITARPGWSQECTEGADFHLSIQLLQCLLEVVSAFHIGRGGAVMSYMGRGVTKSATVCLRHLAFEMATYSKNKEWPENWFYAKHEHETLVETGLNWILTLWAYRDPQVRCAGLGIAVALSSSKVGQSMLTANCQHIPGGIWAVAFSIFLDPIESSLVRQQAAYLLVNLTSEEYQSCYPNSNQGSINNDSLNQSSSIGRSALDALLRQCEFYQGLLQLFTMYYSDTTLTQFTQSEPTHTCLSHFEQENRPTTSADDTPRSIHHVSTQLQMSPRSVDDPQAVSLRGSGVGQTDQSQTTTNNTTYNTHLNSSLENASKSIPNPTSGESQVMNVYSYPSIVTPSLITATCHLLHNLVILSPQETLNSLQKHSIFYSMICLMNIDTLNELYKPSESNDVSFVSNVELTVQDLLSMHCSIIKLIQVCCLNSSTVRHDILNSHQTLNTILELLCLSPQGCEQRKSILESLWQQIFELFTTLLQLSNIETLESLVPLFENHWTRIFGCLGNILKSTKKSMNLFLMKSSLVFLTHILAETGKIEKTAAAAASDGLDAANHFLCLLESKTSSHLQANSNERHPPVDSYGSILCEMLLKIYDTSALKKADKNSLSSKQLSTNSLKCLLAVSPSAKQTALKAGLIESILQQIKDVHSNLNMEFLQLGKQASFKKQSEFLIQELIFCCDLLRNFVFQDENVKLTLYGNNLAQICHVLWNWCLADKTLLSSILQLMINYTTHFPKASASMAYTHPVAPGFTNNAVIPGRMQLSSNSLVHCLVKLVTGQNNRENFVLVKPVFDLLSTLMVSGECRNILWKVNFLQEFSQLNQKKLNKKKPNRNRESQMEIFWLDLFVALSFSMEGQQMIFKVKDSIELLFEFSSCNYSLSHQGKALLVLRNLCCHSSNKNKLLTYNKLLPTLLLCLASESGTLKMIAASSLWALIYNNQKAKVMMKNANILPNLQETMYCLSSMDPNSNVTVRCQQDVQNIIECIWE